MSCLAAHDLARFATEGGSHAHLDACVTCRGALARQTSLRALVQRALPAPTLAADERRALVARIVAAGRAVDSLPAIERATPRSAGRPQRTYAIGAVAVAAAAAAAFVVAKRTPGVGVAAVDSPAVARVGVANDGAALDAPALERAGERYAIAAADDAPPLPGDPIVFARGARVAQMMRGDRAVFALADGMLELDTRQARDGEIVVGAVHIAVRDARVRVRAHAGAVTNVQVVVGAARIDGPGVHATLERDTIWEPALAAAGSTEQIDATTATTTTTTTLPTPQQQVDAPASTFAAGMLAYRAGRDREAIALFDRATDPAVAEDAAYWAAQAALRAGDRADAARRFDRFLATYPTSAFAARARRAKVSLRSRD